MKIRRSTPITVTLTSQWAEPFTLRYRMFGSPRQQKNRRTRTLALLGTACFESGMGCTASYLR